MIKDGLLVKAQADEFDASTIRLWTPEVRKAINAAKKFKLYVREYDTEADLFIPTQLWPKLSKKFGLDASEIKKRS